MPAALPLHPGAASRPGGPAPELRVRRDALFREVGPERWRAGSRVLLIEAARATLELTGAPAAPGEVEAARGGGIDAASPLAAPLRALSRLEQAASGRDPSGPLIGEVHALAAGESGTSSFRASQIEPQFSGASLSPPQTIPLRFGELLGWVSGQSGRDLDTPPRAALFFARFLEISPFRRGNFRVAHLMLSFFALADGHPPIWFEAGDAAGIREDVSRAFRFDTGPLTARIERALDLSLTRITGHR